MKSVPLQFVHAAKESPDVQPIRAVKDLVSKAQLDATDIGHRWAQPGAQMYSVRDEVANEAD